jgi:hypothetical protein
MGAVDVNRNRTRTTRAPQLDSREFTHAHRKQRFSLMGSGIGRCGLCRR